MVPRSTPGRDRSPARHRTAGRGPRRPAGTGWCPRAKNPATPRRKVSSSGSFRRTSDGRRSPDAVDRPVTVAAAGRTRMRRAASPGAGGRRRHHAAGVEVAANHRRCRARCSWSTFAVTTSAAYGSGRSTQARSSRAGRPGRTTHRPQGCGYPSSTATVMIAVSREKIRRRSYAPPRCGQRPRGLDQRGGVASRPTPTMPPDQ